MGLRWCGFAPFLVRFGGNFFLSCCIAVVQNQAVCGIQKFSANFNAVCSFLMLFCAVFIRISVRFCRIRTPLTPPASTCLSVLLYGCKTCLPNFKSFQNHIRCPKEAATYCPGEPQCTEIFVDPASRLATHDQMWMNRRLLNVIPGQPLSTLAILRWQIKLTKLSPFCQSTDRLWSHHILS